MHRAPSVWKKQYCKLKVTVIPGMALYSFATQYMQNFGAKCSSCKNLGSLPFWGALGNNSMTIGNNDGRADLDAYQFSLGNVQVDADGIGGNYLV